MAAHHRSLLVELAQSISDQARVIADMLDEQQLPQPSFTLDAPLKFPEGQDQRKLQDARMSLLTSTLALEQLVTGPQDFIMWQSLTVMHDQFVLHALERFGVFDAVPTDGDISYPDLAARTPLTEKQVRRIIRHARTKNLFTEPRPDHVAHNAFSIAPIKNPLLKPWIGHNLGEMLVASSRLGDAIAKYGDTDDVTRTGLSLGFGLGGKSMWEWFAMDDDDGRQEKGGSSGHVSISLAHKFPSLKFIVADFPELRTPFDEGLPTELKPRVVFEPTDLLSPQPGRTADVFFLRHILHDWPDTAAIKILRNIINTQDGVIRDGTRILIADSVIPPAGTLPQPLERLITALDLHMWCSLNAGERTQEDWIRLFMAADQRLEVKAFVRPEGSADTFIELVFRDSKA
ncbi:S-adenosyl-L-methionine-dependent methyltransferase [Cladophialophora carrionii]|uniref:S-adenosyl-L-methionine-dependent methyltransferase n=1 Tax=Cladophialophora carrionii TaxID=86049 RepID=A0A1C1C865_9EURO|nr:S-adenosyl-L-methionine-dependent methyltransferase [Cladophialophora carrionii]